MVIIENEKNENNGDNYKVGKTKIRKIMGSTPIMITH